MDNNFDADIVLIDAMKRMEIVDEMLTISENYELAEDEKMVFATILNKFTSNIAEFLKIIRQRRGQ